ncbi:MAG: class I tRNA ligase family protein [Polyangiaceae bacterium]
MQELPKAYEPVDVEPRWYQYWQELGVFRAGVEPGDTRPTYVIPMPPPNVTGSLHMGHALMGTIEDALIRHARMSGKNALWQPGIDHAGIATQTVVERQLKREGKTRHDLGRAAFTARIWQWKEQSGGRIAEQMRVLGCSADWERTKFTMDSGPVEGRQRGLRPALRRRSHLSGHAPGQLGRRVANGAQRFRGRNRRRRHGRAL